MPSSTSAGTTSVTFVPMMTATATLMLMSVGTLTVGTLTSTTSTLYGSYSGTYAYGPGSAGSEPSDEQRAAYQAAFERREQEARDRRERQTRATAVAEALLLSVLDSVQAASYRNLKVFEVVGSHGGRYRIGYGTMGNVEALNEDGTFIGALCCHPLGNLPVPDVMLAQMLHLTTDEPGFVAMANVHRGRRPEIAMMAA